MKQAQALAYLADRDRDPASLRATFGSRRSAYLDLLFAALVGVDKRAKNRAAKLIAQFAASEPQAAVRKLPELVALAGQSGDTIVLWNSLDAIGHLAGVDQTGVIAALLPRLRNLLADESMITTGHAIRCLGRIAAANPALTGKLVGVLAGGGQGDRNPECADILAGKVIAAFEDIRIGDAELSESQRRAMKDFARSHEANPHKSTATAAAQLIKRLS